MKDSFLGEWETKWCMRVAQEIKKRKVHNLAL